MDFRDSIGPIIVTIILIGLVIWAIFSDSKYPQVSNDEYTYAIICLDGTEYLKGVKVLTPHYKNGVIQTCQK